MTEEALGPGGEQKLQDALAAGEKVDVPLPPGAGLGAGAYDALEKDIVAHPAMETPARWGGGPGGRHRPGRGHLQAVDGGAGHEEASQEQMRALGGGVGLRRVGVAPGDVGWPPSPALIARATSPRSRASTPASWRWRPSRWCAARS